MNLTIPATAAETYVVYMHRDPDDGVIKYIGATVLSRLFEFEDARSNSLWPDIFLKPGKLVTVAIDSYHEKETDAYKARQQLVMQLKPFCNMKGFMIPPHHQSVVCNETGEKWRTLTEAARAHNLAASALSNHLNGKPGHRTVKGRTYRRSI